MRMSGRRRACTVVSVGAVLVTSTAVLSGVQPGAAAQTYYAPITGSLVLHGHGYGHGHGMSQHGAQGAALAGKRYHQILRFYYPRTDVGRNAGPIRVLLTADTTSTVVVRPTRGLRVRDLRDRKSWRLPSRSAIDSWAIKPLQGQAARSTVEYHDTSGWHRWQVPGRGSFAGDAQFEADRAMGLRLPGGSVVRYRGALRAAAPVLGSPHRDTVNVLSMDDYVRGVIASEMPASWEPQALRSQAVAARTYASYLQRSYADRYYQICDTTACQVYGGASAETPSTDTAVAKTAGQILTYRGKPALTQFSASSGGWTSSGGTPYLPAKKDPYDDWNGNTVHDWTARISIASLESKYPALGRLEAVRVTSRDGHGEWGGRVRQLVLEGSRSDVTLSGDDLRWAFGLRSTWFTIEPTPIMAAWRHLGGRASPLGPPRSAEELVRGNRGQRGARQVFASGRAYWSPATGAHALRGAILRRYRHAGGPGSRYGFPVGNVQRTADGGAKARFQQGMFFRSKATGPQPVWGRILVAYGNRHFSAGRLGYPVTSVQQVTGGLRSRFQHGAIRWDRGSNKVTITHRR